MTHFVFPMIVMAVLWATSHRQWVRFMKRFATLLGRRVPDVRRAAHGAAVDGRRHEVPLSTCSPTAPQRRPRLLPHRFRELPATATTSALSNGNGVAAMPSLHASFALIVPAFFLPWIKPKWLKALVLVFPVIMLTSLVYLGEHWVIDGLVGWAHHRRLTFLFWNRMEHRTRRVRAERARAFLPARHRPNRRRRRPNSRRCRHEHGPAARCCSKRRSCAPSPTPTTRTTTRAGALRRSRGRSTSARRSSSSQSATTCARGPRRRPPTSQRVAWFLHRPPHGRVRARRTRSTSGSSTAARAAATADVADPTVAMTLVMCIAPQGAPASPPSTPASTRYDVELTATHRPRSLASVAADRW